MPTTTTIIIIIIIIINAFDTFVIKFHFRIGIIWPWTD